MEMACQGAVAHLPLGLIGEEEIVAVAAGVVHDVAPALVKGPVGHQVRVVLVDTSRPCRACHLLASALQRCLHALHHQSHLSVGTIGP